MSKIATYSLADSPLQLSDRLIGTEAPRPIPSSTPLATKNFSLGELLQLFSENFPAPGLQGVLDTNNAATQDINLSGTIYADLIKPTNIEDMLNSIGTPLQILSKGVGGICWIDPPSITAVWGSITGTITNQTDLINYLSFNYVPYIGATSSLNLGEYSLELSDTLGNYMSIYGGTIFIGGPSGEIIQLDPVNGLSISDSFGNTSVASYGISTIAVNIGGANITYAGTSDAFIIPDKGGLGGTFAMLSDIPAALDLQGVTNIGNETTTTIVSKSTGILGPSYRATLSKDGLYINQGSNFTRLINGVTVYDSKLEFNSGDGISARIGVQSGYPVRSNDFKLPYKPSGTYILATTSDIGTWGALNYPTWTTGTPFVKMTAAGTFALDTNTYITQDDVEEYADLASFPVTGTIGTIYIALDTGLFYSWNGAAYVLSSAPNTGITGVGFTNRVPLFTSPTTLGNSIIQQVSGCVYINRINAPSIGNTMLSVQREAGQSQIDFSLGNPTIFQESVIQSNNTEGIALNSKGYLSLRVGLTYTEGLRISGTGQIQLTQTPATGTTSDKLLVRDSSGNIKQIDYPTSGGIPHTTASGTDTYTATVTGVVAYADGDAYLVRFTNGNTTGATLNINTLGAVPLYRNNDGPLLGGDIADAGEMLCVYNSTSNTFQVIGISPNSLYAYVTNADSVTITKGMPVYAFGGTGDRMTVKRAKNTGDSTSAQTVGLVMSASIAAGQKGLIMMQGLLDGLSILPTATWADGDPVYLGATDGSITNVKPYAPNHLVYLGVVTTASNGTAGRLYVRVQNGYELDELHNVQAQSPTLKDTLWYDNTVSPPQWKTASIQTILGAASTSANGYLTSNDWNTFNNKQNKTIKQGYTTLTGVTGTQVIASILIPANTYTDNDIFKITFNAIKSLTAAGVNFLVYQDTSLNGTTNAIATGVSLGTTQRTGLMERYLTINGTNLRSNCRVNTSSWIVTAPDSLPLTITGFNNAIDNYITFTANPTVATEIIGFNFISIQPI